MATSKMFVDSQILPELSPPYHSYFIENWCGSFYPRDHLFRNSFNLNLLRSYQSVTSPSQSFSFGKKSTLFIAKPFFVSVNRHVIVMQKFLLITVQSIMVSHGTVSSSFLLLWNLLCVWKPLNTSERAMTTLAPARHAFLSRLVNAVLQISTRFGYFVPTAMLPSVADHSIIL